ncbi:MAG: hypothetical protein V4548_06680 [Bacteroidota bacterium]
MRISKKFTRNLFVIIYCCIFNTQMVNSQIIKTFDINSKFLGGKRTIKIWKPQNFKSEEATQIIYVFDPLWLFNSVCATVESYSNYKIDKIPQTIVVGVYYKNLDDRMDVGYSIQTEKLNKRGKDFFKYVHEEVDSYIKNEFKFTPYRIYVGWSYLAQYADYLIENKPDFYDSYILFSPEYKNNNIDYLKLNNKRIYIASAGKDTQKRNDYASLLYEKMKRNGNSKVKYEKIANASHMDIYTKAFPYALDFIYEDYINQNKLYNSKFNSAIDAYAVNEGMNEKYYNTSLRKNAANFLAIASMNGDKLTSADVDSLVFKFRIDKNSDANLLEIIGGFYRETNKNNKAHYFLNRAIKNYKKNKFLVKDNMTNTYLNLGLLYLGGLKNNKKAFNIFKKDMMIPNQTCLIIT